MASANDFIYPPDTRANQPAAGSAIFGALYCVTDEDYIIERNNGTSWEQYSTTPGGGAVTATGSPANGNLTKFSGATSITNGDLTGAVTTSGGLATTLATGLSPDFADISLDGQLIQTFVVEIVNTAGTLQHRIVDSTAQAAAAGYASKITGASSTLANTPSVGAGVNFTNGVGIVPASGIIVFNTAAQDTAEFFGTAIIEYYSGNVTRGRVYVGTNNIDVNGTTRVRLIIAIVNDMTAAAWNINTTNLPSGQSIWIRFTGYLT